MKDEINNISQTHLDRFFVKDNGKILPIDASDIIYIKSDGNYIDVNLKDENHLIRGSLSDVEEKLDPAVFFRIHRSYIVNAERINYIEPVKQGGDFTVQLSTGDQLRMSRRYKEILNYFSIEE
ncbi:MAG: LytR/AlgR family response regulator transcription factor [Bacteroidota bacterium]